MSICIYQAVLDELKEVRAEISSIKTIMSNEGKRDPHIREYMNMDKLLNYLESLYGLEMAKSTIYKLTSTREIPYRKAGNNLIFIKREIDQWCEARLQNNKINNNQVLIRSAHKKNRINGTSS